MSRRSNVPDGIEKTVKDAITGGVKIAPGLFAKNPWYASDLKLTIL